MLSTRFPTTYPLTYKHLYLLSTYLFTSFPHNCVFCEIGVSQPKTYLATFYTISKSEPNCIIAYPQSVNDVDYFVDKSISIPLITKFFFTFTASVWKNTGSASLLAFTSPVSHCPFPFSSTIMRSVYVAGFR